MKKFYLKNSINVSMLTLFKILSVFLIFVVSTTVLAQENYRGIVVYIDFSDIPRPADVTEERMDNLLNSFDYSEETIKRSFSKYWYEQSRGKIILKHDIFYYRAPKPASYYAKLDYKQGVPMWGEALESVVVNNPDYDWDRLSRDERGRLRSVMFYNSENFAPWIGGTHYGGWTLSNGVKVKSVYGANLIRNGEPSLFIPIHESGHAFFHFPDTYDTSYDSGGTGAYTVMSGGATSIIEPIGAPFRVEAGWGNIIEPVAGTQTITLKADGDTIVVYKNPMDEKEYFSIEARKKSTLGNDKFPTDLGLLVWHTDLNVKTSNREQDMTPEKHYVHSIEQADGLFELERNTSSRKNQGNEGDMYIPGRTFTDSTIPNSKWWNGSSSHFEIKNIQFIDDDHIQFDITVPDSTNLK